MANNAPANILNEDLAGIVLAVLAVSGVIATVSANIYMGLDGFQTTLGVFGSISMAAVIYLFVKVKYRE